MGNWFNTQGFDTKVEKTSSVPRFWMPVNAEDEKEITFLDDTLVPFEMTDPKGQTIRVDLPVVLKEHQLQIGGSWKNWFTCLAPMGCSCPICQGGNRPAQIAVFTVIDHSEWTPPDGGPMIKDQKKLWVAKMSQAAYKVIKKQAQRREGLRGCRFIVQRLGNKSPNVGDTFEFIRKDELPDELQPFNYMEALAPKSEAELRAAMGTQVTQRPTNY
jgi:hypothetical protein